MLRYYVQGINVGDIVKVEIWEVDDLVVTKTGAIGKAMTAKISYGADQLDFASSVYHPSSKEFDCNFGAVLALERVLEKYDRDFRKRVWAGFFALVPEAKLLTGK